MYSLKGKTVVITGGAVGIGYQIVRECLQRGVSNVAILDFKDNNNVINTLNNEFPKQKTMYLKTDVADAENVRESFGMAHKSFGKIDIVFGNAGMLDESQQDRMIQVNLLGIVHSTNTAIDFMSTTKGFPGGSVVNIASTVGLDTMYSLPAYTASKHGVLGFTMSMSDEYYHRLHGVRMMCICPGMTDTAMLGDAHTNTLDPEEIKQLSKVLPTQTAAEVAKCAVNVLESQKNGSVWIVNGGKSREIIKQNYWKL